MRPSSFLAVSLVLLFSIQAEAQTSGPPPVPSNFDPTAKAPPNLPTKLDIPVNTRIDVKASRKTPRSIPTRPGDPRLAWDPDLESAVIERGARDVHAVLNWEGGNATEAFVIRGLCFRIYSLAYPDMVGASGPVINLSLSLTNPLEGSSGDFPGIYWYSPSGFVGTASVNGNMVYVFAPSKNKPNDDAYPGGMSICLDSKTLLPVYLDGGNQLIYTFTYSADPNVQINPQGNYLQAVIKRFGHYP